MQARDAPGGRQRRRREERKKAPTPERPPKALEVKPPRPPSPPGAHASAATPPHPLPSRATRAPLSCSALALAPRTPAGERWEAATARDHPAGEGPRLTSPTKTDTTHTAATAAAALDRGNRPALGDPRGQPRAGAARREENRGGWPWRAAGRRGWKGARHTRLGGARGRQTPPTSELRETEGPGKGVPASKLPSARHLPAATAPRRGAIDRQATLRQA